MPINRSLLGRLLKLFPAKVLKEYFDRDGNVADIIDAITGSRSTDDIVTFVRDNYLITRQHIHFFELGVNFSPPAIDDFPLEVIRYEVINGEHIYFCLPTITYEVTLYSPLEESKLEFLQPVVIRISGRSVKIHFTKIEKNVSPYYPENRGAVRRGQNNNEEESLRKISNFLINTYNGIPLDINRGVKNLWDRDIIDARKVQWRKNSSTAMETMDEQLTFKEQYPVEYVSLTNQPLGKTLFKYMLADGRFCDMFDVDATRGQIGTPKFLKDATQITNVITEILANN